MTINLQRLLNLFGKTTRDAAVCPDRVMDGERTDRDLALLAQAEREYRETIWRQGSLLSGTRQ
jgi:hypothetical protein